MNKTNLNTIAYIRNVESNGKSEAAIEVHFPYNMVEMFDSEDIDFTRKDLVECFASFSDGTTSTNVKFSFECIDCGQPMMLHGNGNVKRFVCENLACECNQQED